MTALHMGALHPFEHVLVYLLAFGPFLLLALTIWVSRRRAEESPDDEHAADEHTDEPADDPTGLPEHQRH